MGSEAPQQRPPTTSVRNEDVATEGEPAGGWSKVIDEGSPGGSVIAIGRAFENALRARIPEPEAREEASFHLAEIIYDAYGLRRLVAAVLKGESLTNSEIDTLLFAVCEHVPYHQRNLRTILKSVESNGE